MRRSLDRDVAQQFALDPKHLVTHAVVLGMTGSGKTGLLMVLVEEAIRNGTSVLLFDIKGDLANLGLLVDPGASEAYLPWLSNEAGANSADERAAQLAASRTTSFAEWNLDGTDVRALRERCALRILTPGSSAGEPVNLLSSLACPLDRWNADRESARDRLCATVSMILRLVERDADPASSRDHVLLSTLAEHRIRRGVECTLEGLLRDLADPPIESVGALSVDEFVSRDERRSLAASLNALLASPSFAVWREGSALDVGAWLRPREDGRTPAVVVSLAHLDDHERVETLAVLLEEVRAWVRSLPGTDALRTLVVVDEAFGVLPPHPANPPTRRPLVSLLKQGRAYGVGVVVATQNPMDLDYRALSNAGLWFVGRLQTDGDRKRVIEGLAGDGGNRSVAKSLGATVRKLRPRWFVLRDAHDGEACWFLRPRDSLSWLRGPMTREDLRRLAREAPPSERHPAPPATNDAR
jgi:DNA helicase HerA-like ATPase